MERLSWMIDSHGEPIVVMPASEFVALLAGSDDVCVECSLSLAKQAEQILPYPWREAVNARMEIFGEDEDAS